MDHSCTLNYVILGHPEAEKTMGRIYKKIPKIQKYRFLAIAAVLGLEMTSGLAYGVSHVLLVSKILNFPHLPYLSMAFFK